MQAVMATMKAKRKQWLPENMGEVCKPVKSESMTLREAARAYNVPAETLRRRVAGTVSLVLQRFQQVRRKLVWLNTVLL